MSEYPKNTASPLPIDGLLIDRTDGSEITAGASVQVKTDGGTFAAGGGTLAHKQNGVWQYTPTQAETNANHIAVLFLATNGSDVINVYTTERTQIARQNESTFFDASGGLIAADIAVDRIDAKISAPYTVDGKTQQQAFQYIAATVAGLITDAGAPTETFVGLDQVTNRVQFTVDASGNRTAVTYDP